MFGVKPKLAILAVLVISVGLVGNAYAHKITIVDSYKLEIGWTKEPPVAGKTNKIELVITKISSAKAKSPDSYGKDSTNATIKKPTEHDHKDTKPKTAQSVKSTGVSGLAKSLEVDVTLDGKKTHLKLTEDKNQKGRYVASYTPKSEGHPTVHVYGKIGKTEIEATLHPEKVVAKK